MATTKKPAVKTAATKKPAVKTRGLTKPLPVMAKAKSNPPKKTEEGAATSEKYQPQFSGEGFLQRAKRSPL